MRTFTILAALVVVRAASIDNALDIRDVDETYPYTGPAIPVGDWVDPTVNGNGKGFPRLVEPPAVKPATSNPSNNVNVIALSYIPGGINIHYQTPFGLGKLPAVQWGTSQTDLDYRATGYSHTYDRTPPCSMISAVTQCSQFFHEIQISGLKADTTYYYLIPAANGTTASDVLSFTTARAAGDTKEFTIAVLNDMGYTNAGGTYKYLNKAVDDGIAFAWHGGISATPMIGILGYCLAPTIGQFATTGRPRNYLVASPPPEYLVPIPEGEIATQGGPQGGDMSVLYESNWDLWQQWMVNISSKVPYMTLPGNHEATCSEFDGPKNILTAYLNDNISNGTAAKSALTYYSCPPSQRNFTAYQNRFRMPGEETGGVGNMWYSFDYGLAHFISLNGETDFANSPEFPFARDLTGDETRPMMNETYVTDSGPFGAVGNYSDTKTYAQYQWLEKDLASIDRTKTPWVLAMTHRPMYSSQVSSYQKDIRDAFEALMLKHEVDIYLSGHIHWYERLWPLTGSGAIDSDSIVNNNTYYTNPGVSMTHIINGAAGNIESHSTLAAGEQPLNITAVLDFQHYGFIKLKVFNATALSMSYIEGDDGSVRDEVTLLKKVSSGGSNSTSTSVTGPGANATATSFSPTGVAYTTQVVTAYTTYCPGPTTFTQGSSTYTVTQATTLTISNCPCTITHTIPTSLPSTTTGGSAPEAPSGSEITSSSASPVTSIAPGGPESAPVAGTSSTGSPSGAASISSSVPASRATRFDAAPLQIAACAFSSLHISCKNLVIIEMWK